MQTQFYAQNVEITRKFAQGWIKADEREIIF